MELLRYLAKNSFLNIIDVMDDLYKKNSLCKLISEKASKPYLK